MDIRPGGIFLQVFGQRGDKNVAVYSNWWKGILLPPTPPPLPSIHLFEVEYYVKNIIYFSLRIILHNKLSKKSRTFSMSL